MIYKRVLVFLLVCAFLTSWGYRSASATPQAKTYTVNSDTSVHDANPGDGVCATPGGNCTLHAAIEESNLDGDYSTIKFASKFQGTHTISGCSLPALTEDNTTIDASDRWDNAYRRPGVELTCAGEVILDILSDGNTVLGLFLGGSGSTGVRVFNASNNHIGGYDEGQRNVFLTGKYGVHLESPGTYNYVSNNYIGTIDGDSLPGGGMGEVGVFVQFGSLAGIISNNLIAGQSTAGIFLWSDANVVSNNIIGMTWNKSNFLPNKYGIQIGWGNQNVIGGGNVIAGNSDHGVYVYHADDNLIYGNYIGYPFVIGSGGNDGDGVHVHASADNTISEGNVISENGGNGIYVNGSAGTVITGNGIGGNTKDGIHMKSSDGQIGDSGAINRNGIGGNGDDGIHLDSSSNVTIKNNYIGLDSGAFDAGNQGYGILMENGSSNNTIGGEKSGEGNWIGWNQKSGIFLTGSGTQNNYLLGNVLGAPINWGWEAPNGNHGIGVYDGANDNWIGDLGAGNTIIASGWSGVAIVESSSNRVLSNRIGTNGSGVNWGNTYFGVHVVDSPGGDVSIANAVTFNEIAYNGTANGQDQGQAGVKIDAAVQSPISANSIHHNDGPGIQLVNSGNTNLPPPTISQASCKGPVKGKAGGPGWIIEIFSDTQNEGRYYEGQTTADTQGNWTWSGTPRGPNVTATARTPANDTSPFSSVFTIGGCTLPQAYLPLMWK